MQKILIKVTDERLTFSFYGKSVDKANLNNTNIINTENIIFTEEYIAQNIDLVSSFLNVVVLKNDIKEVAVKDVFLAKLALRLINYLPNINSFSVLDDVNIASDLADVIYESKNIIHLNCYNISNFMFEKLSKKMTIDIRSELLFISDFMQNNNLETHSDIYYKKQILIDSYTDNDFIDFETFLKTNKKLKVIEIKNYNDSTFKRILELLITYNRKNVKINIIEENENISTSIDYLKKLQNIIKKNKIKFNIIYSSEYKEKYLLKQLNLNIFMTSLFIVIALIIGVFVIYKFFDFSQEEEIKNIEEKISEINEEENSIPTAKVKENEESEYTKRYSKVFSELKKINNETVGWLKVNNTNVDYPIVRHTDNDYYLNHSFSKKLNQNGWLFADYRNKVNTLDANTIIYGHNDGQIMFGSLKKVLNKNWHSNAKNQIITFNTESGANSWQIFSIYTIPVTSDYLFVNFSSPDLHTKFIKLITDRSIYDFNQTVSVNDKILTLSTCYNNSDYRLVIHAKKIA